AFPARPPVRIASPTADSGTTNWKYLKGWKVGAATSRLPQINAATPNSARASPVRRRAAKPTPRRTRAHIQGPIFPSGEDATARPADVSSLEKPVGHHGCGLRPRSISGAARSRWHVSEPQALDTGAV